MDRLPGPRWNAVLAALERWGLLFAQDAKLPSVTTLVAVAPVAGSWWPHPRNREIYDSFGRLERAETFSARLLDGKWVYVHARLVPAVHAVAASGEPWQEHGLSPAAAKLLRTLRRGGEVLLDAAVDVGARRAAARAATELERRLLAESREVHTSSGHHARRWNAWHAPRHPRLPNVQAARRALEDAVAAMNAAHGATARLPWQRPASSRRKARRD
jgi:hypothetical protein